MTDSTGGRLGRRELLRGAGAVALLPLLGACSAGYEALPSPWRTGSNLDRVVPAIDSYLDVTNAHTQDRVALRFMEGGTVKTRAARRLDYVFRDWRQNEDPEIDPRVYMGLAAISHFARQQGHPGQITLLSGFRTQRTNQMLQRTGHGASSNSYHLRRRAADIRLEGIPPEQVAVWADWLQVGGTGRYANFTHIDSGPTRGWNG